MNPKKAVNELHGLIFLCISNEDVKKSAPAKEETMIEVEVTSLQKRYYKAIKEKMCST
jgi:SNF2 family DNA or RNA helicase